MCHAELFVSLFLEHGQHKVVAGHHEHDTEPHVSWQVFGEHSWLGQTQIRHTDDTCHGQVDSKQNAPSQSDVSGIVLEQCVAECQHNEPTH